MTTYDPTFYVPPTTEAAIGEEHLPRHYRLAKKPDGSLILQGAFYWTKGWPEGGFEWREITIVELDCE